MGAVWEQVTRCRNGIQYDPVAVLGLIQSATDGRPEDQLVDSAGGYLEALGRESRAAEPERRLLLELLTNAVLDVMRGVERVRRRATGSPMPHKRHYPTRTCNAAPLKPPWSEEAAASLGWLFAGDEDSGAAGFTVHDVCHVLGISLDYLRRGIEADVRRILADPDGRFRRPITRYAHTKVRAGRDLVASVVA